jgi:divinyl chlorophyllide a 8-vinyl-reductase
MSTQNLLIDSQVQQRLITRCAAATQQAAPASDYRKRENKDVRVLVVGPTGYIGKFVVKELIMRGYNVVTFAREQSGVKGKASKEDTVKVISLYHVVHVACDFVL